MSWQEIVGHDRQKQQFCNALSRERLASTFLFVGPKGIGKYTFARQLAKMLLCERRRDGETISSTETASFADLDACDECSSCCQVAADSHPDLLVVRRLPNKNKLSIDQFVGEKEKRGREGLCHDISLKPFRGGRKIAIIDDADFFNQESANCLLKTLEEPPPKSVMILIGTSEQKQLPTIRSRCQIVRFDPLTDEQLETVIRKHQLLDESFDIAAIARCGGGSVETAVQMSDSEAMSFRMAWLEQLATLDPADENFAKTISAFVDAAGKDAAVRRDRLRLVSEMAIGFYRSLLLFVESQTTSVGSELQNRFETILETRQISSSQIANCLERCFDVQQHIAANANQATIVESWLCDLGRLARGESIEAPI